MQIFKDGNVEFLLKEDKALIEAFVALEKHKGEFNDYQRRWFDALNEWYLIKKWSLKYFVLKNFLSVLDDFTIPRPKFSRTNHTGGGHSYEWWTRKNVGRRQKMLNKRNKRREHWLEYFRAQQASSGQKNVSDELQEKSLEARVQKLEEVQKEQQVTMEAQQALIIQLSRNLGLTTLSLVVR